MPTKRTPIIAGNWKMNSGINEGIQRCQEIVKLLPETNAEVIICPPFPHLYPLSEVLKNTPVMLGAQTVHKKASGAYTGDVGAFMVVEAGAEWVIIGHSERRQYYGETGADIREKILLAQDNGLTVIFCVGERIEERESNVYLDVITRQINEVLDPSINFDKLVIAYEPVWSIGTGKTASPEQANEVHMHIRQCIYNINGGKTGENIRVIYGGSMKPDNAAELLAQTDIDGGLIGGASLNAADFCQIVSHAG